MNLQDKFDRAFTLQGQRKHEDAAALYNDLMQEWPENPDVWHLAGGNLCNLGRFQEGLNLIQKAISIEEKSKYHVTIGQILSNTQYTDQAEQSFSRANVLDPENPKALFHLGFFALLRKDFPKAASFFQSALKQDPNYVDALFRLGNCYQEAGDRSRAGPLYELAFQLAPRFDIRFSTGTLKEQLGNLDEALHIYVSLIKENPNILPLQVRYVSVLERLNKLEECRLALETASQLFPKNTSIELVKAKTLKRSKQLVEANDCIAQIVRREGDQTPASVFFEAGIILDKLGRFEEAFANFKIANSKVLADKSVQVSTLQSHLMQTIDQMENLQFRPQLFSQHAIEQEEGGRLVFILGFPRTGTTLIDAILSVHPGVKTFEESPALERCYRTALEMCDGNIENVAYLTSVDLNKLRRLYFEVVNGQGILIDRHPFNTWKLPLIRILFPQAKLIMTKRNELDTALSCYMQDFDFHQGTAHLFSVTDTLTLFKKISALVENDESCREPNQHPIYYYRYEDLVSDTKATVSGILGYIGLEWMPEMSDHTAHSKRAVVSTISYDQVALPVYSTSADRSKNYSQLLSAEIDHSLLSV